MNKIILAVLVAFSSTARASEDVVVLGHTRTADPGALKALESVAPAAGLRMVDRILADERGLIDALLRGEIDVAIGSPVVAIAARAHGRPVVLVAGFAPSPARILARKALGVERVADLSHRRVAVQRDGSAELLLLSELRTASLTWSEGRDADVQLVHLAAADLDPALRSGYVDAIVQQEPLAARALQAGYANEIPHAAIEQLDALLTTEHAYAERRLLERLVRCLVDAGRLIEVHEELARRGSDLALEHVLWRDEVRDLLGHSPIVYAITPESVAATARLMLELGVGSLTAECAGCRTQDFVKLELLAQAVGARGAAPPSAGGR